jgi:hypothetical protein
MTMDKPSLRTFEVIEFPDSEGMSLCEIVDGKEVFIMYGDAYHDKIEHRIEGFFDGLSYLGVGGFTSYRTLEDTDMYERFAHHFEG